MFSAREYEKLSDLELVELAKTGHFAFSVLYQRHYGDIFRFCAHRLFDREAAEDVTALVFLKVVEHLDSFEGRGDNSFSAWVYRIASNQVNLYLRKKRKRNKLIADVGLQTIVSGEKTHANIEVSEKLQALKKAIQSLKPKDQAIITFRFFERINHTKIAEIMGITPVAVRSRLSRTVSKLRKKLSVMTKDVHSEVPKNA